MAFVPSTFERKWPTVILTPISVANHIVTVSSTAGLHEKQKITLSAIGQEPLDLEIKRVLSDTTLQVGPVGKDMALYANPTAYSGGTLTMSEQERNQMGSDIVLRAVYEEGPAVALRNVLVNRFGTHIDSVTRTDGKTALAVDASVSVVVPPVEVALDALTPNTRPDPDNVLIAGSEDGTKTGAKYAFVNNLFEMILKAKDRTQHFTYADFGTKDQRIIQIDYTAPSIGTGPGFTARKTIPYTLVGTRYRRDDIIRSLV